MSPATPVQVVGIGLDGLEGLSAAVLKRLQQADVIVGSPRQLDCAYLEAELWPLGKGQTAIARIQARLKQPDPGSIVVLASGDPLFFGLGRLLLEALPAEALSFYPHPSSVQLAFSRLKLPWQDAKLVSIHGRDPERLMRVLRQNPPLVAVLTDPHHSPGAIAQILLDLDLPQSYTLWVCEALGSPAEAIHQLTPAEARDRRFDSLSVVVLQRQNQAPLPELPQFGLPDSAFLSFEDRPGLITKREVRVQILGELALQPGQTVWDIGAGTGSVSIEIARLMPTAQVYAIEKTQAGIGLIEKNIQRFNVPNVQAVAGQAAEAIAQLPAPDRVFIGGSGGELQAILDICSQKLLPDGQITLALATLEHQQQVMDWRRRQATWQIRLLQVQLARSVGIADLTRWSPLNPVVIVSLWRD